MQQPSTVGFMTITNPGANCYLLVPSKNRERERERLMMQQQQQQGLGGARVEKGKKKLPTPKEMVAHYESKGMQPQEASLKVIDDLQNLLLRVVTTKKTSDINTHHLLRLESKLDSKPGYPQTIAIGVVSGAVAHALPHLASIWNYVRSSTSSG